MHIKALESHGIDSDIIRRWIETGHSELLPIQEKAIVEGKVLEGQNVVVFSPTSSGKTFIAEMAAVRTARKHKRVLYLVPQKALAEEKFHDFRNKYSALGIRVVISTRDRQEFDRDIRHGNFHIAVTVFEKMQGLLVSSPGLLSHVGLVVVDELQMLGDRERGGRLELLLAKIKISATKAQIIGLSAVMGGSERLARWLNATLCQVNERPVELRKGVIYNGEFRFIEQNSQREAIEKVVQPNERGDGGGLLIKHVLEFFNRGEQCLVFCKSKAECLDRAQRLKKYTTPRGAATACEDLSRLEVSGTYTMLSRLFEHGIAYHNTDLSWEQRDVVERHFRAGEIRVIFATTTLAMGLNFPAKNVFLDPNRWEGCGNGRAQIVPLSQAEYENISGRAGRYTLEPEFGRAIIVTDSQFDARTFYEVYARGTLSDFEPALDKGALSSHILNLVAGGLCQSRTDVRKILLASFTGEVCWRGGDREIEFYEQLSIGLDECIDGGLIQEDRRLLIPTELGLLAAMKGIAVTTAIQLAQFAITRNTVTAEIHPLEVLYCLARTADSTASYFNFTTDDFHSGTYEYLFKQSLSSVTQSVAQRLTNQYKSEAQHYQRGKLIKKVMVMYDWIRGISCERISVYMSCSVGTVQGLAEEFTWLAEALCGVAQIYGWPDKDVAKLKAFSRQLAYGVPAEGVEIMALRVPGVGRERTMSLINQGIASLKAVAQTSRAELEKLMPKLAALSLIAKVKSLLSTDHEFPDSSDAFELNPVPQNEINEAFPSSDDNGCEYKAATVTLHLIGRSKGKRVEVMVNEKSITMRPQSFEALLKLALASKRDGGGWVPGQSISSEPSGCHTIIHRIRQELKLDGIDTNQLIENDVAKRYRLSILPANIRIDAEFLLEAGFLESSILKELQSLGENNPAA